MSEFELDLITLGFSFTLFWGIIILLILYPKIQAKKIQKRINSLQRS